MSSMMSYTFNVLKDNSLADISWVVVDNYLLSSEWETSILLKLRTYQKRIVQVLAIDDLWDRAHNCHILLNPNHCDENVNTYYAELLPSSCDILCGSEYSLLSSDFSSNISRQNESQHSNILIFFGGSDPLAFTYSTLKLLCHEKYNKYKLNIVISSSIPCLEEIIGLSLNRPNTSLHLS